MMFHHSEGTFGPQILEANRFRTKKLLNNLNMAKRQYQSACQVAESSLNFDWEKNEKAELVSIDLYDHLSLQVSDFLCYSLRLREDVRALATVNRFLCVMIERFMVKERPLWMLIRPTFDPQLVSQIEQNPVPRFNMVQDPS